MSERRESPEPPSARGGDDLLARRTAAAEAEFATACQQAEQRYRAAMADADATYRRATDVSRAETGTGNGGAERHDRRAGDGPPAPSELAARRREASATASSDPGPVVDPPRDRGVVGAGGDDAPVRGPAPGDQPLVDRGREHPNVRRFAVGTAVGVTAFSGAADRVAEQEPAPPVPHVVTHDQQDRVSPAPPDRVSGAEKPSYGEILVDVGGLTYKVVGEAGEVGLGRREREQDSELAALSKKREDETPEARA